MSDSTVTPAIRSDAPEAEEVQSEPVQSEEAAELDQGAPAGAPEGAQQGTARTVPGSEADVELEAILGAEDVDGREDADAEADRDEADEDEGEPAAPKSDKSGRLRQLEREGEVAADFLETLLDIADLDGDIDVDVDGDRAAVAIVDSEEGRVPRRLVGTDGKVLEALQELTRLAVQVETGERSRLMLDVAGHRAERRAALVQLAATVIATVKESGTKQSLEPMSAFERKVVHDEVAAAGLTSESEGVEPRRHIVILP